MGELPEIPNIQKLSNCVTCVLAQNPSPFTLQGTNTYLVGSPQTNERLLIDTGSGNVEYFELLKKYLEDNKLKITTIAITHSHIDHLGGVEDVLKLSPGASVRKYVIPKGDPRLKANNYFIEEADAPVIHWEDKEVLETAGVRVKAYYTPGHCADHLSFWLEDEQVLFSGDNLLGHGSSVFDSYQLYIKSLMEMRDLPHLRRVFPGHGKVLENGVDAFNSLIEHRYDRIKELYDVVKQAGRPLSGEEIVASVYSDFHEKPRSVQLGAINNTKQYLEELERQGRVEEHDSLWSLKHS